MYPITMINNIFCQILKKFLHKQSYLQRPGFATWDPEYTICYTQTNNQSEIKKLWKVFESIDWQSTKKCHNKYCYIKQKDLYKRLQKKQLVYILEYVQAGLLIQGTMSCSDAV